MFFHQHVAELFDMARKKLKKQIYIKKIPRRKCGRCSGLGQSDSQFTPTLCPAVPATHVTPCRVVGLEDLGLGKIKL